MHLCGNQSEAGCFYESQHLVTVCKYLIHASLPQAGFVLASTEVKGSVCIDPLNMGSGQYPKKPEISPTPGRNFYCIR